ncbi:uncharacterized protein LOC106880138 [Octopus bimaculoides]|uniref:Uncharacterized protein n=1 Tax=Octopus bimaculoides TaxID=37653 RepID=A0A0L8FZK5_OCTBM|nr:uncharacterized protein LOC106880138 [Octopus bimaculoides]|eukprot:XP_014785453.1 PREDICTED: uncharacterized protein LOC106880138 [Octopus bimaculoides]
MAKCLCFVSRRVLSAKYVFPVQPKVIICNRGYARKQRLQPNPLELPTEKEEMTLMDPDNDLDECFDDYYNSPDNKLRSKLDLKRIIEQEKKKVKLKIMQRKYFKSPQEVNFLTWRAKEQIRFLNAEYPEEWTLERLSQSFPISKSGLIKLLSSTYVMKSEEILKHDSNVKKKWKKLKEELSLNKRVVSPEFKHLIESGKLELLKNAGGLMEAPKLPSEMHISAENSEKKMGRFESILQNYERFSEKQNYVCNSSNKQTLVKLMPTEQDTSAKIPNEECNESKLDWSSIDYEMKETDVQARNSHLEPSENLPNQITEEHLKNVPRKIQRKIKSGNISLSDLTYLEAYQLIGTEKVKNIKTSSLTETNYKNEQHSEQNSDSLLEELLSKSTSSALPVADSPERMPDFSGFTVEDYVNIPEHVKGSKGTLYKKDNAYYDENGEFLYKVPISE